jgi:hypothetical protein
MPMNRIQFQPGLSMPEFLNRYGTEPSCEAGGAGTLAGGVSVSAL